MNLRHRPAPDEAAAQPDRVLLEHWTTVCGRPLALRVTAADGAAPDTVVVQVCYGDGQAELLVVADERASEVSEQASAAIESIAGATGEREEDDLSSSSEEKDTAPCLVDTLDRAGRGNVEVVSALAGEERRDAASLVASGSDPAFIPDAERVAMAADVSRAERHDPAQQAAGAVSPTSDTATERAQALSPGRENQESATLRGGTHAKEVGVMAQAKNSSPSGQQKHDSAPLTAELNPNRNPDRTAEPIGEHQAQESGFPDQTYIAFPDENNLVQRTELHIGKFDPPVFLDDSTLEIMLRAMPALRRLSVDWRPDGRKLDVDVVTRHCRNLVELDLTRFRLDVWSLEQLCAACPRLEVVKLPWKCDDSHVEVLLRNLPRLLSLDLSHTKVTGQFLGTSHGSLEKLLLAGCVKLNPRHIDQALRSAEICPHTGQLETIRVLDLTSMQMSSADRVVMLRYFPRLERLSVDYAFSRPESHLSQLALCEHVRDISILHGHLNASELVAVLIRSPQLERLSLAHSTISDSSHLRQLEQGQIPLRLQELDVTDVKGLATADLAAILSRSPQLRCFRASQLTNMDLTACLTQLSRCAELRELDVSRQGILRDVPLVQPNRSQIVFLGRPTSSSEVPKRRLTATQMVLEQPDFISRLVQPSALTALLSGCRKLERLALAGCYITESAALRQLSQCPELRELDLSRVTTSSASGAIIWHADSMERGGVGSVESLDVADLAQGLGGCPLLERLSVADLRAPLEQLVPPSGLPCLNYLDASRSGLANNSLRRLPGLFPRLHTLVMRSCSLVSEDGLMSYLPRLQHLRFLDLRGVPGVTDDLLGKLKQCPLTKLRIDGPGQNRNVTWTTKGLVRLVDGCKTLKFIWLEGPGVATVTTDAVRQRLSPRRILVLVTGVDSQPAQRPGGAVAPDRLASNPRPGHLHVLRSGASDWDKY